MAKERARQTVDSNFGEPWNPEKAGDTLEGTYLGFDDVPTRRGEQKTFRSYKIRTEAGDLRAVSGSFLGRKMAQIPKGTYVWITFQGMTDTANGEAKDFTVECEKGTKLMDINKQEVESDIPY